MTFTELFPALNNGTYLNTASSGLLSEPLLTWRRDHDLDFLRRGSDFRLNQESFIREIRERVAGFFSASAENTFLVPNFSFGFNTFLSGLSKDHRFLLLDEDYPSLNRAVEGRGFASMSLKVDINVEEDIIEAIRHFRPSIFAFSLVQYISGIKIELEFLKKLKVLFPDLLLVADGTQYCGTERFDFEKSPLDVMASSGYKWMLAGYGNGFIFFKDEIAARLYPEGRTVPPPKEPFLKNKNFLSLYFEPGHLDTLALGSLYQAVLFMEKTGMDFIEEKIRQLSTAARTAFAERCLLSEAVAGRQSHSSIFNLNLPESCYPKLNEAGITYIVRGPGARVSFHFYNTPEDLGRLLEVIDSVG